MENIINNLHKMGILGRIIHTVDYCLQRELSDCETVLDIGCGPSSPLQRCKNIKFSVGVEAFKPYLLQSKRKKIHTKYINDKIENLDFKKKSFDAVILIEVLEHFTEKEGKAVLKKAEKWAKKKVIVTSPNGYITQESLDNNPLQQHLSGWELNKMKKLGFCSSGLAGLRFLRQEVDNKTMGDDLTTSIRFHPKLFWFTIATVSQIFTFYVPNLAFELFSVKYIKK